MPARFVLSLVCHLLNNALLIGILIGASVSGITAFHVTDGESAPAKADLVELEFLVTQRHCRQHDRRDVRQRSGKDMRPLHRTHGLGQARGVATPSRAEYALCNGGLGTALRC